jgi:hypothetical protein
MNVPSAPNTPSAASTCRCGFEVGQILEGLHQHDQARAGVRDGLRVRIGEQPSRDAAQLTQPRPAPAEDRAQEFGQRVHVLPMCHRREYVLLDPFSVQQQARLP